jgi:FtsH-binding integral membrane protein
MNPVAYAQLSPLGVPVGIVFLLLAVVLALAATGWWRHRRWGWILAAVIIVIQVVGAFLNLLRGDLLRGAAGVVIASALLFYMTRPRVRAWGGNISNGLIEIVRLRTAGRVAHSIPVLA